MGWIIATVVGPIVIGCVLLFLVWLRATDFST